MTCRWGETKIRTRTPTNQAWRIFIHNFGDLSNFFSEIDIFVTGVSDFKFCVNLGLRISNFANLSISQNFKISQILSKQFCISQIFCGF